MTLEHIRKQGKVILGHLKEWNKIDGMEPHFPHMAYSWPPSSKALMEQVSYRELSLSEEVSLH